MKEFLYFSATWCGPCRQLGPTMSALQQEGYKVRKIDVDADSALAAQHNVRNIPTVIFVNNGKETSRTVGNQPKNTYINIWNNGK